MIESRSLPNRAPTVPQLITLVNRSSRKPLTSAEIATLRGGIEALAEAATGPLAAGGVPSGPSRREAHLQRLLDAASRLYADSYGLTQEQAVAEIRAEAGR